MKNIFQITVITLLVIGSLFLMKNRKIMNGEPDDATYSNLKSRIEWETNRLINPETGEIPEHIRQKELDFSKTIPSRNSFLRDIKWIHQGPYNVGGRTRGGVIEW